MLKELAKFIYFMGLILIFVTSFICFIKRWFYDYFTFIESVVSSTLVFLVQFLLWTFFIGGVSLIVILYMNI